MEQSKTHYVVCLKNRGFEASLETRKIYESIPDSMAAKHDQIRIIDESGEDYVYPAKLFIELKVPLSLEQAIARAA
jgi:hypothetical protein